MQQERPKVRRFTRCELHDLVWSRPMKTLAADYGISDVGLAKACRRHGIPVPPRGHWAKLQAGKRTVRQPLPARGLGMPEVIAVGGNHYWQHCYHEPANLIEMEIPPPPEFSEPVDVLTERVRRLVGRVTIPKNFKRAHRLVARLLEDDDARRAKQLASRYPVYWEAPKFESPFERRRLRLINAIFVALERAGTRPSFRGSDPQEFYLTVGEECVTFTLDHPRQQRDRYMPASKSDRPASDKLQLAISAGYKVDGLPYSWEDKGENRIEDHVDAIVVTLIVAGELHYRRGELSRHAWLVERKAARLEELRKRREEEERRERERRIAEEKARIDRLLGEAAAFRQANDIRAYVRSVQTLNTSASNPVPDVTLAGWAAWALAQADRIDPVLSRAFLAGMDPEIAKSNSETLEPESDSALVSDFC